MARKGSKMIREKPANGRYLREYFQGGALAQLASQKLPTAQRMLAAVGMDALTAEKGLFGKDRSHTLGDFVWLRGLK